MANMRKYASTEYLKAATLGDEERIKTIAGVIDASASSYDKPTLIFKSGARMSLNKTNTGELCRVFGEDSESWIEKTVKIYVGQTKFNGTMQDGLLLAKHDSAAKRKKPPEQKPEAGGAALNAEIPFAPEWRG
jgi:hypothetical protein